MSAGPIIDGIVLAAGASRRMGSSKALLDISGQSFLEHAIAGLRSAGCRYVVAVVNSDDDWSARLADVSGGAVVVNDNPDSEQIDSLRLAIANLPEDSAGAVVLPVDFPRIHPETMRRLIAEFRRGTARIVNPSYNGVVGHPVVFARSLFAELLRPDLPDGARSVMSAHAAEARTIEVDDPGITADVDTPADYEKHVTNETR